MMLSTGSNGGWGSGGRGVAADCKNGRQIVAFETIRGWNQSEQSFTL
eukprot:SAG11_NODE_15460_length_577_cov_1.395397_1_plen_46_part_01